MEGSAPLGGGDEPIKSDGLIASQEEVAKAIEQALSRPCKVDRVLIAGLERTKQDVVRRELADLAAARTLDEIHALLVEAHSRLEDLDVFKAVEITIDESPKFPEKCVVMVRVYEKNLFGFHAGTYVQGAEGNVEASLNLTNPFGYAEMISLGVEQGTQHTNTYSLSYTIPKPWGHPAIADIRINQLFSDKEFWSSYVQRLRGGTATVTSLDGRHALSYECSWERLANPSRTASRAIIGDLGDYLKSAFRYSFSANTFDNIAFPREGWGLKATTEVAGVGPGPGLLRFAKQHLFGQLAFPVGDEAAFHVEAAAGVLLPWGAGGRRTCVSERFFLGGIGFDGLRGFQYRGIGPTDNRRPRLEGDREASSRRFDALGGDVMCSLLGALRFYLPGDGFKAAGLRGQVFVNCGSVGPLSALTSTGAAKEYLTNNLCCSVGAGIIWPTGIGKLELNVCRVLRSGPNSQVKHGIQFGITPTM